MFRHIAFHVHYILDCVNCCVKAVND